ncbi:MAG: hypothetical protein IKU43_10020 [Clostridia bacterium]|nr:hypothetical protein [Clostridia bacterium]
MKTVSINLSKNTLHAKPIRNILGINNLPLVNSARFYPTDKARFDALNFRYVRFHDSALENPGMQLVDISKIFPLFHLDETREENYFFKQTDLYMKSLADSDAEVDFRLGETIDHSRSFAFVNVPADIDKWARICRNIIGHYKNGEMNGMHLNITRVTVWEEPDTDVLFTGSVEDYAEMFIAVYKLLKKDFPDIKVGGPTCNCRNIGLIDKFLRICSEKGVRPDYIITTMYTRNLEGELSPKDLIPKAKAVMDKYGLSDTKYSFGEWHYGVADWSETRCVTKLGFNSSESAAFSTSLLVDLMDIDYFEIAYFYAWRTAMWGLTDFLSEDLKLLPIYYAFMLYQKIATECVERLAISTDSDTKARLLAGKTADGKTRVLVSCFAEEDCIIKVCADGADKAILKSVNKAYDEKQCTDGVEILSENGTFDITHIGRDAVYFLEF